MALVETHVPAGIKTSQQAHKAHRQGYMSFWSLALCTGRKGTHGRQCLSTKRLRATHLTEPPGKAQRELQQHYYTPIFLKVGSVQFVFAPVYLDFGLGFGGANLHKLAQTCSSVGMHRFPRLLMGVWNSTPDDMEESMCYQAIEDCLVVPDYHLRCTTGTGRLLDCAVCPDQMLPLIKECWHEDLVPWKPHLGLRTTL